MSAPTMAPAPAAFVPSEAVLWLEAEYDRRARGNRLVAVILGIGDDAEARPHDAEDTAARWPVPFPDDDLDEMCDCPDCVEVS